MVFLIVFFVCLTGILFGKFLLRRWFNHLTVYCIIWSGLILLHDWKLLPYYDITTKTWFYILSVFLSYLFGIITISSSQNLFFQSRIFEKEPDINFPLFADGGKTVRATILFLSGIAIFSGIHHWYVLINMFGSIPAVLINANIIYSLNVKRGIEGFIPYLPIIGYVGVFFAGIYTAYKGRFSLLSILPFLGIVLKETATLGRSGMLLALMEFLFAFILFRHLLKEDRSRKFKYSKKNIVLVSTIIIVFFIASASLVRVTRISSEYYAGASRELKQFKNNLILSPSIYHYFSADVGVLNEYLKYEKENVNFGQNTFLPVYDFLTKLGAFEKMPDVQIGYFIPMWVNTGTFIRELHADFGIMGIFLVPYLLGIIITWLWFKFYRDHNLIAFAFLVYFYLIIGFSFLHMITRVTYWPTSLFLIVLLIPILERLASKKSEFFKIDTERS